MLEVKKMEIWVDKLPENCESCPLRQSGFLKIRINKRYVDANRCVLGGYYKYRTIDDEIDTCPLQSIADHDAELLKNAIVPKFNVGEKVFYIDSDIGIWYGRIFNVRYHGDGIYADTDKFRYEILPYLDLETRLYDEKKLFATRKEAEQKLKEIEGKN